MSNCQLVVMKTDVDGIGNVLKGFISALCISDNVKIECNPPYMYGAYDTILDKQHIYDESEKNIEKVGTCRFLILKEEEHLQDNIVNEYQNFDGIGNPKFHSLFCSNKFIDWNYNPDKVHPIIKKRIFNAIDKIKFYPLIPLIIKKVTDSFKNKVTLGISIRTWKGQHETNIQRPYSSNVYMSKIQEVLEQHPEINHIILSIDNNNYIDEYINYIRSKNKSYTILNKNDKINDIQYAFIKVLILAECNYFIGNRISTFSELVFWFSKHNTKVYTVF